MIFGIARLPDPLKNRKKSEIDDAREDLRNPPPQDFLLLNLFQPLSRGIEIPDHEIRPAFNGFVNRDAAAHVLKEFVVAVFAGPERLLHLFAFADIAADIDKAKRRLVFVP
ncbi:MAG: hypothetical protein BWY42_01582 [Candidatus Omnitrophica bacterium ADurb.Bin277]|nr:MAG: hypothetical protein BWY42_01582 [Candidatus Omnitrophica bacterium ADurb.Bin277]